MRRAWLAAALLAAGCAQLEVRPPAGPLEFDLAARIAARHGSDAFTGTIAWRHAQGGDEMLISTPTGQGVARIVREGDAILIETAESKQYRSRDAEELTERVLGFRVPLAGLAEWVQGRPAPELESRGWRIEVQEYDAERRPARLRVINQGVELRLAVTQWK